MKQTYEQYSARYDEFVAIERRIKDRIEYRTQELRYASTLEERNQIKHLIANLTRDLYLLDAEYPDVCGAQRFA